MCKHARLVVRRKEVVRCGMTDLFNVVCEVCIVSRWMDGGLFMCIVEAV